MKRMLALACIVLAGLGVCGALVVRHAGRTAAPQSTPPPPARMSAPPAGRAAAQPLPAKLRAEEQRQRPWEARN